MDIKQYLRGIVRCHLGMRKERYIRGTIEWDGSRYTIIAEYDEVEQEPNTSLMDICTELISTVDGRKLHDPDARIQVEHGKGYTQMNIEVEDE